MTPRRPGQALLHHINFMKVHQPNLPHPDFIANRCRRASTPTRSSKRTPHRHVMDKLRELGLDKATPRVLDHGQRRLAGRLSRCRLHAVPRHQGHRREGGNRVPAIAWMPGKIKAGARITTSSAALISWPRSPRSRREAAEKDLEGKPMIFDSYDMSPVLFGTGKSARETWFYFTENELLPGRSAYTTTSFVQSARRRRRHTGGWQWTQPGMEGRREVRRDRSARSSISGRIRRNATTSS
jgi:arylsulfatase